MLSDYAPAEMIEGEVQWFARETTTSAGGLLTADGLRLPGCPGLSLVRIGPRWSITHHSGIGVLEYVELDDARRAATALVELCPGWDRPGGDLLADPKARAAWDRVRAMHADGGREP